jgi:signal transduction histidine kinase
VATGSEPRRRGAPRALAPARWLHLPPRSARLRLTLLYGGLTLLLGTALLAITYLLVRQSTVVATQTAHAVPVPAPGLGPSPQGPGITGIAPSGAQAPVSSARHGAQLQRNADLARLLATSWVELVVITVGSAAIGWFAAGRVLRPLQEITSRARTISAGNLHERLSLTGPDDEFKQLGDTLDELLARLEASFEAQRRFVANASHELRTPLTLERTILQVALANPEATVETLRATCEELLGAGAEHARLLEALLTLTSSERGLEQRELLELSELAGRTLADHRPGVERLGLRIHTSLQRASISGDEALVRRLIANLIDNAVDHNVARGELRILTWTYGGEAVLTVVNTGHPIPADQADSLFEPFQRLNGGRTAEPDAHHGLGLSIVRAIAVAHHASVTSEPQSSGGLAVTVRFASAR